MQSFNIPETTEIQFLGYNDKDAIHLLPKGYFVKADNVFVTDNKITKVTGSSTIASAIAAQPFNGFASFERYAASTKYLVVNINGASNAQLYSWNGSGNFTSIGTANLTNSKPMNFAIANDLIFGFNGVEEVDWDGTTYTKNRSGVPLGYYGCWFHGYLWVANTAGYPNRVFWSDLGTPTTFTGTNYVDVNAGDSDQITGLSMIQDELLVFKRNTIWSIAGWAATSFSSTNLTSSNLNARIFGYGATGQNGIVSVGNDVYYFSMLGNVPVIRSLKKTINAVTLAGGVVSDSIKGTLADVTLSALGKIISSFDGRYIYWAIPTASSTTNNKIIALDTWKMNSKKGIYPFTTMTGKNASFFANSTISGGTSTVFFTDAASTGKVFKFNPSLYTDDGNNIAINVISRGYMGHPSRKTHWKYMYLKHDQGVNSTLNVKSKFDSAVDWTLQKAIDLNGTSPGLGPTGTFTLGTSTLGGATIGYNRVNFAQQIGRIFQTQFTETSSSPVTIYEYTLMGNVKGLRQ